MAENAFHIVPKNVKKPHIANDMGKTAVHEHRREKCQRIEFSRDKSKGKNQCRSVLRIPPGNIKLPQEDDCIQRYHAIGYKREKNPRIIITIGKKH